jgi:pyruvate/2-oxoglutarate/acetoin dehydrogenase E1 component
VADGLIDIFDETDEVPELLVPTSVSPLNLEPIAQALAVTRRLIVIEEGAGFGSVGAEAIAQLQEAGGSRFCVARVSGKAAPIPSAPALERAALPSVEDVCVAIIELRRANP